MSRCLSRLLVSLLTQVQKTEKVRQKKRYLVRIQWKADARFFVRQLPPSQAPDLDYTLQTAHDMTWWLTTLLGQPAAASQLSSH